VTLFLSERELRKMKRHSFRFMSRWLLGLLALPTVFTIGLFLGSATDTPDPVGAVAGKADDYKPLRLFADVLALVQKNYYKDVSVTDLVEGSVKGMLMTLDPHSGYLPPQNYEELQVETQGSFGGLGIEITIKDNLLTIVAPIEDSPAARAGVMAGDQIIKIEEEFTKDITLSDAVQKMRGPRGSSVTISVNRKGARNLIPITIVRDVIKVKSVHSRMLEDGFAYVRLAQFQEGSASEFESSVTGLEKESSGGQIYGLVLDLRNNPGGLLTQAIRVADLFLTDGIIVYTDGRLESQKQKYFAHDDGNEPVYPMVILVNEGSASASEIVAGAFQDHGRAIILGTPTFGKGSVQTVLPMTNGAALKLTTALYYTKSGRSIQAEGIQPDILSEPPPPANPPETAEAEKIRATERNLPGAISNPNKTETGETTHGAKKPEQGKPVEVEESLSSMGPSAAMKLELSKLLKLDPQLAEALRLLKTWHVFQGGIPVQASSESRPVV